MPVKMADEEDEDIEVIGSGSGNGNDAEKLQELDDFDNMLYMKQNEERRKKSDMLSKKMGEYLLQGWAMLQDACSDCLFPLMKSRKGEIICVGCGPINGKKEEAPKKEIVE